MREFEYTAKAMGTDISISLILESKAIADKIYNETIGTIGSYEARFSRFLHQSELSKLNQTKDLIVSDTFFDIFTRAQELFHETKGVFNPLVQIARLGYTETFDVVKNSEREYDTNEYSTDFSAIVTNSEERRIILLPDQKLDFGGFLKGFLAEQLSQRIQKEYPECRGNIVNIGGDLHTRGYDATGKPFICTIYNPITQEEHPVTITDTSLATSGTYARTWNIESDVIHHILRTDGTAPPNTPYISASCITQDGAAAEAYAKVLLMYGPNDPISQSLIHPYEYLLIDHQGNITKNI